MRASASSHPSPAPRVGKHQRGFTLLELLVTLGITVIGLTGLMSLHIATVRGNDSTGKHGEAVAIAQETLETLRADKLTELLARFSTTTLPVSASLDTVSGRGGITFRRQVEITELTAASPDLYKMRVVVAWSDDNSNGSGSGTGAASVYDHQVSLELIRTVLEAL